MPYKPTGNPPGRPRKVALLPELGVLAPKDRKRARRGFRDLADRLNPSEAVQILDSRGRPRRAASVSRSRMA